jgi:tetratricopeptide (TPR) repeat protein
MESQSYQIRVILDSNTVEQNKQILIDLVGKVLNNPLADPFYKFQAATSLVNAGELQLAFTEVQKLNRLDENNLIFLDWLARYFNETKNYDKEINMRMKIADLDPWNAKNYLQLGRIYKVVGNQDGSKAMLEKILSFANGNEVAKQALIELN